MASTISSSRQALYSMLAAHTFPGDAPQLAFGAPGAYEEQEVVLLMGVEAPDEDDALFGGPKPRDEIFTLVVGVKVHDPAGEAVDVDARGFALADEVRDVVYGDSTLGGSLSPAGWARIESQTTEGALPATDEGGNALGWVIVIEVRVRCRARIS